MEIAKDVSEYIANSPKKSQPIMEDLREIIKSTVPEAEERIAWKVPNYKLNGVLAGFAVYTKHISLGFSEGGLNDEEREFFEKAGFKTVKGTVQIKFTQEIPKDTIVKTLKRHAKLNKAKSS
ncbi:iron chaperone [Brumimicrobium mesophilum]|uniref:iron chaperone n=1 Tax=Brumimicrobium mesophilum TaxID=392717 RepID=UPI000D140D6A|nr:DUF1801 domain-containing protein [Brumimicrobium mesophilum]